MASFYKVLSPRRVLQPLIAFAAAAIKYCTLALLKYKIRANNIIRECD